MHTFFNPNAPFLSWQQFLARPDNKGLNVMQAKQKYLTEQANYYRMIPPTPSFAAAAGGAGSTDTGVTPYTSTYSLSFDGTDDRVNLDSTVDLNDLSISIWVKPGDVGSGNNGLILGLRTANSDKIEINNATTTSFKVNGANTQRSGTPDIVNDQWQHLFITRISNTLQWYLNGSTWGSSTSKAGNLEFDCIGFFNNGGKTWLGELDDIAVWNTDQTTNISTIYNGGVPGDISSLSPLHWWTFNEGSGTTAIDAGSGGNNGTINGATYSTDVPD